MAARIRDFIVNSLITLHLTYLICTEYEPLEWAKSCRRSSLQMDHIMDLLKLMALDPDDLNIISAHFQDAVLRVEDIAYLPREQRLAFVARRFDWQEPDKRRRRLAAMHFNRVQTSQVLGIDLSVSQEILNLLAITFTPSEPPAGIVTLIFAQEKAIRLHVECLEAQMKDLGPVWETENRPAHGASQQNQAEKEIR
jgi:hypothetical protein